MSNILSKSFDADLEVKAVSDKDRTIEYVITKEVVDRDGDVVEIKGFSTKNFMKNPVFIYAHDTRSLPIGKVIKIRKKGDEVLATIKYATPEEYSFSDTVYKLAKGGFINAVSVGFIPDWTKVEYPQNEKIAGKKVNRRIKSAEMIELSQVPVPANQEALSTGKSLTKALESGVIDDVEYKEYDLVSKRSEELQKINTKDEDKEQEMIELKSYVAELELQLKEFEIDNTLEESDVYDEIYTKMFTGTQASDKGTHTDEHTEDTLDINTINKLYEEI